MAPFGPGILCATSESPPESGTEVEDSSKKECLGYASWTGDGLCTSVVALSAPVT
jgi:hypothetical protein